MCIRDSYKVDHISRSISAWRTKIDLIPASTSSQKIQYLISTSVHYWSQCCFLRRISAKFWLRFSINTLKQKIFDLILTSRFGQNPVGIRLKWMEIRVFRRNFDLNSASKSSRFSRSISAPNVSKLTSKSGRSALRGRSGPSLRFSELTTVPWMSCF